MSIHSGVEGRRVGGFPHVSLCSLCLSLCHLHRAWIDDEFLHTVLGCLVLKAPVYVLGVAKLTKLIIASPLRGAKTSKYDFFLKVTQPKQK